MRDFTVILIKVYLIIIKIIMFKIKITHFIFFQIIADELICTLFLFYFKNQD